MRNYECTAPLPTFHRRVGPWRIVVQVVGPGGDGSWGYTVWDRDGQCVAGRSDPEWDDVVAARHAELAVCVLEVTHGGGP